MQDFDVQEMIGPSVVMSGRDIELEEAIRVTRGSFQTAAFVSSASGSGSTWKRLTS